jgi:hypothetical protein
MNTPDDITFRPRPSGGQYWVLGIGIITLLLFVVPLTIGWSEIPLVITLLFLVIGAATTAPLFTVAWYVPVIRYTISGDELILSMGRLMHEQIPVSEITRIEQRESLKISILASFRFPGLAVFDVDYIDAGRVRMLSTSANKNIILIDTPRRR